jgi:hypothetical protein
VEIRPVGAELSHDGIDRRTDMMDLIVAFRNIANAPKMKHIFYVLRNDFL